MRPIKKGGTMVEIKKGDIFYADLGKNTVGCEQRGVRPVVVIQNNVGNKYSPTVIIAAITSSIKKANLPTHIKLSSEDSKLPSTSVILLEQIRTIDKSRLVSKISTLDKEILTDINDTLKISLGID